MVRNMARNKRNNVLSENQYIISPQLHEALERENINEDTFIDKQSDGIYLVMFRVLNKDSNTLVYNYIYYNPLFLQCLVFYFILRVDFSNDTDLNEKNDYLVLLDSEFLDTNDKKKNKLFLNKGNWHIKYIFDCIRSSDFYIDDLLYKLNKLIYTANYEEMSYIILLANRKEYIKYINEILGSIEGYTLLEESLQNSFVEEVNSINLINGCLFVVKNLKFFIDNVKEKGYTVNGGPQAWRNQVNSINNFLICLDNDFRNSLYKHNRYHVYHKNIDSKFLLNKNKFSFNNIDMNLGKVRWYSTNISNNKSGFLLPCQEICLDCLEAINWFCLNKKGFIISTDSVSLPNVLENKAGIYIYQSILDKNIIYIGSAFNIPNRLVQHRYCVNNSIKSCPNFYNSVKEFGWDNFRLGILEYIDIPKVHKDKSYKINILRAKEEFYLNKMNSTLNVNKLPVFMIRRREEKKMRKIIKFLYKSKSLSLFLTRFILRPK